ncbi:site-2 protease family protein [Clostridium hydrogeniformans]|uniref:site-2 protease family protein n=1 Tax=Clostridium hydrogeniformans TaxID=349933 RepID=UPI000484545B|nr:site-2 protease family protein [Clostridium hydrogeniformans]
MGFRNSIQDMIMMIPAILIGFTFHEYAHAKMADRLGDKTARFQGRLTLNPFHHIDIMGFIFILIAGFGWAKPVETNPRAYKNYYKDDLKVSLAGPLANLTVAVVGALILGVYFRFIIPLTNSGVLVVVIFKMLHQIVNINVMLFIFNLLPLPGFDGYHVLRDLYPKFFYKYEGDFYKYRIVILVILFLTPVSNIILKPVASISGILFKVALGI